MAKGSNTRFALVKAKRGIRYFGLLRDLRCDLLQWPVRSQTYFNNISRRLPERFSCRRHRRSASIRRSRFPVSVPPSGPAGSPIPAGALGGPTSPHVSLYSSDTPNQQHCTHRSRSDWRSRRPHPYLRSLFTDFLHCGAANCGVTRFGACLHRMPHLVDVG